MWRNMTNKTNCVSIDCSTCHFHRLQTFLKKCKRVYFGDIFTGLRSALTPKTCPPFWSQDCSKIGIWNERNYFWSLDPSREELLRHSTVCFQFPLALIGGFLKEIANKIKLWQGSSRNVFNHIAIHLFIHHVPTCFIFWELNYINGKCL